MHSLPDVTMPLFQSAASDTVVAVVAPGALSVVASVALVVLAVAVTGLLVLFVRIAAEMRHLDEGVRRLVSRMEERVDPVMDRARVVAENAEYISHAVRSDVEKVGVAAERVRRSLDQASERMDERIEEFNALMAVVQSEAEALFLDTASTVHGVKAGTRSLRRRTISDGPRGEAEVGSEEQRRQETETEAEAEAASAEGMTPERLAASSDAFPEPADSSSGGGPRDG